MIEKKELLKIVVIILVVAAGITGYITYKNYRMSQMDKYMIQASQLTPEYNMTLREATAYATAGNYDMAIVKIDKLIKMTDEIVSLQWKAHQYADGPYKAIIELILERNHLYRQSLELWKEQLECLKMGGLRDGARAGEPDQ